jgi:hypothetical protein
VRLRSFRWDDRFRRFRLHGAIGMFFVSVIRWSSGELIENWSYHHARMYDPNSRLFPSDLPLPRWGIRQN